MSETTPAPREPRWVSQRVRILVFVAGASLMALQIAGSRVLAPHFGSSLFIWGALIGVFLLALSAGYFLGGWAGDNFPDLLTLNLALGGAGLLFLLIPHIGIPVCVGLKSWGPRWGPLGSAILLFVLPSIFLGSASPIAVRLVAKEIRSSGRAAGSLYALSTFGSLLGTFLATFVLVPAMGTPSLIMALGVILVGVPVMLQPKTLGLVLYVAPAVVVSTVFLTSPLPEVPLAPIGDRVWGHIVYETETPYHRIFVVEGEEGGKRVRYLQFDHYVESGIAIEPPYHSVTRYTDMFHLSALYRPRPRAALFVGGGGMVGPRVYEEVYPSLERIDVVEIDPEVVEVAKKYFAFNPGYKTHVTVRDGRIFLDNPGRRWDVVVLDAYTAGGRIPFHLLTREFFEKVRARMPDGGVCMLNIIGATVGPKSKVFRAAFKTLQAVFPQVYAFPRVRHSTGTEEESDRFRGLLKTYDDDPKALDKTDREEVQRVRNIFIAAVLSPDRLSMEEIKRRARELTSTGSLTERFHILDHASGLAHAVRTGDLPILTDDYAPVEQWKTW